MAAEADVIVQVLGVLPALDAEIQRLGAIHLLHAQVILGQDVDKILAEAAVAGQVQHLVIGVQQAAGAKDDPFAAAVVFVIHCHSEKPSFA